MTKRPNILLILTDQHRYDLIGANGSTVCRTPHIDALAAESLSFDNAYTCMPICTPARASIFTGLLPHRHGMIRNTDALPPGARSIPRDMPTLAERLRPLGYRCALEGKWHAGERLPSECGFDGLDVKGYGNAAATPEYEEHLLRFGVERPMVTPVGTGWGHNILLAGRMSGPVEASVPHFVAQRAVDWLDQYADGPEPFFLAVCFWGPHAPYVPCEPYASMYDPDDIAPWPNFEDDLSDKPSIYRRYRESFLGKDGTPRAWRECAEWAALAFGFATQVDEQIGRVLERLDSLGLADDTAVLFSTDHGDLLGAHGGLHDKHSLMVQELCRIPLIARLPGAVTTGQRSEVPVSQIDLPATILDLAGCDAGEEIDGQSLLPLLRSGRAPDDWPDCVVASAYGNHFYYEARMIFSDGFKYIFHPSDTGELYDLKSDPWEMDNRIDDPEMADRLSELREKLIAWCEKHEDPIGHVIRNFYGDRSHCTLKNAKPYRS